jgi:hypothetical protein
MDDPEICARFPDDESCCFSAKLAATVGPMQPPATVGPMQPPTKWVGVEGQLHEEGVKRPRCSSHQSHTSVYKI